MVQPDLQLPVLVQISNHTISYGSDYYLLSTTETGPQLAQKTRVFRDWAMAERDIPLPGPTSSEGEDSAAKSGGGGRSSL